MLYLLDTNILSDILKNSQRIAARKLISQPQDSMGTSIIVAAEMRYGAKKKIAKPSLSA